DEGRLLQGLDDEDVEIGWNEPAFSRGVVGFAAGPADLPAAAEDDEQFEAGSVSGAIAEGSVFGAFRGEVRAGGQQRTRASLRGQWKTRNFFNDTVGKVGDSESFFEMKLTRLAGRIDAAVVVDAVCQVGVFLHFEDDHVGADGVLCARRDEKRVAWFYKVTLKKVLQSVVFEAREKRIFCCARFQAKQKRRFRFCRDDVPHFGFATATGDLLVHGSVCVVRVYLIGELIGRENEFYQEGKCARLREKHPAPFWGHFAPCIF